MKTLLLTILCLFSLSAVAADGIDIKGFHVGMRNSDYMHNIWQVQHDKTMTVGGVPMKFPLNSHGCKVQAGCSLFFTGTVDWFAFKFDEARFEEVKAAVVNKYPETVCDSSGCVYQAATEKLTLKAGFLQVEASDGPGEAKTAVNMSEAARNDL